jgi:6-phosphogluconolactonase
MNADGRRFHVEKMQICPCFSAVTERWLLPEAKKSSCSLFYLRLSASICGSNCIVPAKVSGFAGHVGSPGVAAPEDGRAPALGGTRGSCLALAALVLMLALVPAGAQSQQEMVFVGSGKKNIEAFRFDQAAGTLTRVGVAAEIEQPSFLAISPNHHFLYAISEGRNAAASSISAFAIDAAAGKLTFLNKQPAGGAGPCYVEIDAGGKNALIANYNSGSFAVFPLAANGELQPRSAFIQDQGSSVNASRQEGPHAHCLVAGPGEKFAFGCDLGLDKVMIFKFDPDHGTLVPNEPAFTQTKPGAGPRHIVFNPNGRWAYVINEMGSSLTVFQYDASAGTLQEFETQSTLPKDFSGQSTCAEVAVHPSGKFVYASNRGDDSIAVFGCDPIGGRLTFIERVPTGGKTPRQFEIDPSGRYLVAGNQDSNSVVVFSIDNNSGHLQPTGTQVQSDNPMCVRCLVLP